MKTVFETFRPINSYTIGNLMQNEPSSFNGFVEVIKYRVTIEKVEEPIEVIHNRLKKLWGKCDNHHHYHPIMDFAKRHGLELDNKDFGMKCCKKS